MKDGFKLDSWHFRVALREFDNTLRAKEFFLRPCTWEDFFLPSERELEYFYKEGSNSILPEHRFVVNCKFFKVEQVPFYEMDESHFPVVNYKPWFAYEKTQKVTPQSKPKHSKRKVYVYSSQKVFNSVRTRSMGKR